MKPRFCATQFRMRRKRNAVLVFRFALLTLPAVLGYSCITRAQDVTVTGRLELVREGSSAVQNSSNGVVWLTRIADSVEPVSISTAPKQQLVQKNKSFTPHLVVVQVGSSVVFPNKDPFFHNVFSLFEGKRFDLGLYEAGSSRTVVFDREGISYIFCNIHPEMSAVVVAVDTPYFGSSDRAGNISIPNVPEGKYELHVWYERSLPEDLKSLVRTVTIADSSKDLLTIAVPENPSFSGAHKNKYGQDYPPPPPDEDRY